MHTQDPRWGRNQEVATEDPTVNGRFGMQYTRGLQEGEDDRYLQAVVTLKHWDAYSLEDSDGFTRHTFNAIVSNQTIADTYWPAFQESVVTGKAKGVMCSYNALNGVPTWYDARLPFLPSFAPWSRAPAAASPFALYWHYGSHHSILARTNPFWLALLLHYGSHLYCCRGICFLPTAVMNISVHLARCPSHLPACSP